MLHELDHAPRAMNDSEIIIIIVTVRAMAREAHLTPAHTVGCLFDKTTHGESSAPSLLRLGAGGREALSHPVHPERHCLMRGIVS